MPTCPNCGRESPEDFAFCPVCGAPLAAASPGRETRKTVTVVFCDVTGSTALGERLDPESLRDVQSRYFDAMRAAIERHGGTVEKFIGDAVMAVFGIPQLHEDDALRAARAAADMREGLATLNKELERDRGVTIQVRIGVNTGEVVAGVSAADPAFVTGDAVNVAARLEQHAAPGEVLLGDPTYRLVRDAVEAEAVEPLDLKGKAEPVPAWRLLGVREVMSAVPRHLDSPMVGRERPLAQLRQAFDAAEGDEACQLFTILGPAGVGQVPPGRGVPVPRRRAGEDPPRPVPALRRGHHVLPGRRDREAGGRPGRLRPAGGRASPRSARCSRATSTRSSLCRRVSQLMGVADAAAGEDTFWAIRRFFEASARERPLVLVFDDIHWGEPTFLDLVEHIADWSRGSPILLLCMATIRPAGRPSGLGRRQAERRDRVARAAQRGTVGGTDREPARLDRLPDTRSPSGSSGRPRGTRCSSRRPWRCSIDDGLVVREDDRWVAAGDLSTLTVPPSIQALLASRLDRLTPEERVVLEAAAVVGKEFFVGAVRDLVDEGSRSRVPGDLMALVRKELIRPERTTLPGEDAFRFRHLLIRDAAYEAIPKSQRAEMHERFADWLERVAGDAVAEQEEIVAYHLEQAHGYRTQLGPPDERSEAVGVRAAARLASAGRRASGRGDHVAAANLLRRGVDVGPPGEPSGRVCCSTSGTLSDGWARPSRRSRPSTRPSGSPRTPATERWSGWPGSGAPRPRCLRIRTAKPTEEFRSELEDAVRVFEVLGDDAALATVWAELAQIEWMPCRYDRARDRRSSRDRPCATQRR